MKGFYITVSAIDAAAAIVCFSQGKIAEGFLFVACTLFFLGSIKED